MMKRFEEIYELHKGNPLRKVQTLELKCPKCKTNLELQVSAGSTPGGVYIASVLLCPKCGDIYAAQDMGVW